MAKRFSASSAAQLMACPGSAHLELAIPNWKEPVRDDMAGAKGVGTNVHEILKPIILWSTQSLVEVADQVRVLAEMHWTKRRPLLADPLELAKWQVKLQLSSSMITSKQLLWMGQLETYPPAMLRYIAEVLEYMADMLERLAYGPAPHAVFRAEEPLVAEWLIEKPGTTPDVTAVGESILEVVDYKTGKIPVAAFDNNQGLFYAACKRHLAPKATEFTIHILQPGNLDTWTAPISVLDEWMERAQEAERRIRAKDLTLRPGTHCTFCPANPHTRGDKGSPLCPAMMQKLYPTHVDVDEILALT